MSAESTILERPAPSSQAMDVFAELVALLEEYAPTWYTEKLHDRALAALSHFNRANES